MGAAILETNPEELWLVFGTLFISMLLILNWNVLDFLKKVGLKKEFNDFERGGGGGGWRDGGGGGVLWMSSAHYVAQKFYITLACFFVSFVVPRKAAISTLKDHFCIAVA